MRAFGLNNSYSRWYSKKSINRVNHAAKIHVISILVKGGDINMEDKDIKLIEIPCFENLRIDNNYSVYILNNEKVYNIIPFTNTKFEYEGKIIYTIDLVNIVFYGTKDRYKFNSFKVLSKTEIESNGITFRSIPDVVYGYYISETGIVYSTFTNMILKQEVDDDGYHRISFPYPKLTHMAIHRLVYKAWKGKIPNGYVIHHEDSKKWNNDINNLQITTPFLNSRYAAEEGLYKRTFEWNSNIVHHVCKMMEENICVKDIAAHYGILPKDTKIYKNFRNQLYNFRKHQRSWMDITSQYNFNDYTGNIRPDSKYRISDIKEIRNMYKSGKSVDEIYSKYNKTSRQYLVSILKGRKHKNVDIT